MKNRTFIPAASLCLASLLGVMPSGAWADSAKDRIHHWIDDASDTLQNGIDKLGDDVDAIQDYLNNYHWKGIIADRATSGPATLKHLELNDHSRAVVVKPGEEIEAEVVCQLDAEKCSTFGLYRIVVGIKGEGPQAVIGNEAGFAAGKTREKFTLKAPEKRGMYQIRFRPVNAFFPSSARNAWVDEEGHEPDGKTTIGIMIVK